MNAMRKTALSVFLCAVLCAVTAADARDFQFKNFDQSSGERTLNRYMESAARFEDGDQAELFMEAGVEAAVADWEREALAEMELQVSRRAEAGEDENEVRGELTSQLEQQKIQVSQAAKAEGEHITARLLANLVNMVVPETQRQGLHDEIDAALEAEPEEELAEAYSRWDETAGDELRCVLGEVFSLIETNRQGALQDIAQRSETFREVYTSRIEERARDMRELARRDLELYYLRARNRYMYENYQDTDSLRRLSEAESAAVITEDILNQTGQTVEELMAGLDIDEGLEAALLVEDPGQYTREVQSVIQAGICAWKVAEDRLIAERLAWEKRSFASYDEAEEKWKEGYDKLCRARDRWLEEVHEKISDGYQAWEDTFLSTGQQYQEAITLLEETIQVQRDSWDEYTANMRELVVMGSGAMGVATENLGWLREYEQDLAQMAAGDGDGAYAQVRQKVQEQIRQWEELAGRYEGIIARGALQYHEQDMWGLNEVTRFVKGEFAGDSGTGDAYIIEHETLYRTFFDALRQGDFDLLQQSPELFDATALHESLVEYGLSAQFLLLLDRAAGEMAEGELVSFDTVYAALCALEQYGGQGEACASARDALALVYDAYIMGEMDVTDAGHVGAVNIPGNTLTGHLGAMGSFAGYVNGSEGTFENIYGYSEVITRTNGLLHDDRYDDEGNPLYEVFFYEDERGVVILNGADQLAHDPYLLTGAEYELEKLKLQERYWKERLRRSQRVYEYAYGGSDRPSAEEQQAALAAAKEEYARARITYQSEMDILSGELKGKLADAGEDVAEASRILADAGEAYKTAQDNYRAAVAGCLYFSNPSSREIAQKAIEEAAAQVIALGNKIEGKERALLSHARDYYRARILEERNAETIRYATRVERALRVLEGDSDEGITGYRGAYEAMRDIMAAHSHDELEGVLADMDEAGDVLFPDITALFPDIAHVSEDRQLLHMEEPLSYLESARDELAHARDSYTELKNLRQDDERSVAGAMDVLVYLFNGSVGLTGEDALSREDIIARIHDITGAENAEEREKGVEALADLFGMFISKEEVKERIAAGEAEDSSWESMEAALADLVRKKLAGGFFSTSEEENEALTGDSGFAAFVHARADELIVRRRLAMRDAIDNMYHALESAKETARRVALYLLHDFNEDSIADIEASGFALDNMRQEVSTLQDDHSCGYMEANAEAGKLLQDVVEEFTWEEDATGSDLYDWLVEAVLQKMEGAEEGKTYTEWGLVYRYIANPNTRVRMNEIADGENFDDFREELDQGVSALGVIADLYRDELAGATADERQLLFDGYLARLESDDLWHEASESGETPEGDDPLTDQARRVIEIKITEMMSSGSFDLFAPYPMVAGEQVSVIAAANAALYAEEFYDASLEKHARGRREGFFDMLAGILGIGEEEAASISKGNISYHTLEQYGASIVDYTEKDAFGDLPPVLQEAMRDVAYRYRMLRRSRNIFDARTMSEEAADTRYQQAKLLSDNLEKILNSYGALVEKRNEILSLYTQVDSDGSYYVSNPARMYATLAESLLKEKDNISELYEAIEEMVTHTGIGQAQISLLASLEELETLRLEYEYADFTFGYLADPDKYESLEDYLACLTGTESGDHGKTEDFAAEVGRRILQLQAKGGLVSSVMDDMPDDLPAYLENMPAEELAHVNDPARVAGSAYLEALEAAVGGIDTFDPFAVDASFRNYAILLHYSAYARQAIYAGEDISSFAALTGSVDAEGIYQPAGFGCLGVYADHQEIFDEEMLAAMRRVYTGALAEEMLYASCDIENTDTYQAGEGRTADYLAHFTGWLVETADNEGNLAAFEDAFGTFTALSQYQDDTEWFAQNHPLFQDLYQSLKDGGRTVALALLPEDIRQFALEREYFILRMQGLTPDALGDTETFLASCGITPDAVADYDGAFTEIDRYRELTDLAFAWDGSTDMESYINENNITDTNEIRFLRLFSIDPALADPVSLALGSSGVEALQLAACFMGNTTESIYQLLLAEDDGEEKGFLTELEEYYRQAELETWLAHESAKFVKNNRATFTHYRDYLTLMESYYQQRKGENDLTPLEAAIVAEEELVSRVNDEGEKTGVYYFDENTNNTFDAGEKTLADFLEEYHEEGKTLTLDERVFEGDIDQLASDDLSGNKKAFFTTAADDISYVHSLLEEATAFNTSLALLFDTGDLFTRSLDELAFGDNEEEFDLGGFLDLNRLAVGFAGSGYDHHTGAGLDEVLGVLSQVTHVQAHDPEVGDLVLRRRMIRNSADNAMAEAHNSAATLGKILENKNLAEYMEGEDYQEAEETYLQKKQEYENAQDGVDETTAAYQEAQQQYTDQLALITRLFEYMEEARREKEDQEALYSYATTAYLYNAESNADGGDPGEDGLKADARDQYYLAQQHHDEVVQKVSEMEVKAAEVAAQDVAEDAEYMQLREELRQHADRAFRMEKLRVHMKEEIALRGAAYEEAKDKYEKAKSEFLPAAREEYDEERDHLVDRMLENDFVRKSTLENHLQEAAYYYNRHHNAYGRDDRIFQTDKIGLNDHIPNGNKIVGMNSPLYEYLLLTVQNGRHLNNSSGIQNYFTHHLRYREFDNHYFNLNVKYMALYMNQYYPMYRIYRKMYKAKKFGVHYLRGAAKRFKKAVLMPIKRLLDFVYGPMMDAMAKRDANWSAKKKDLNEVYGELRNLQELKVNMHKARASLASLTEIESLYDEENAGTISYYDPVKMETVTTGKLTMRQAMDTIAEKYGFELKESDYAYLSDEMEGGEYVNVNNHLEEVTQYDDKGYELEEKKQVMNAETITSVYASKTESHRVNSLKNYLAHTRTMWQAEDGYDRVIVDRAVEQDLYALYAGTEDDNYDSAFQTGAAYRGLTRAMIDYMSYTEGIDMEGILVLEGLVDNPNELAACFEEYVANYQGFNDRELALREQLQKYEWQIKKKELQDKRKDWDRMVGRIFERGVRQWNMMLKSYDNQWRNWQTETGDRMLDANTAWDGKFITLQQEKAAWFEAVTHGASAETLRRKLASIETLVNGMVRDMQNQYGDVIGEIDVKAIVADLLADTPENSVLDEFIQMVKDTKVDFAVTQVSARAYDREILGDFAQLDEQFQQELAKTENLQLIRALTELLSQFADRMEDTNKGAARTARTFVNDYNYQMQDGKYVRFMSGTESSIPAFSPFRYNDSLVLGDYTLEDLTGRVNEVDNINFQSTMEVVLKQVEANFDRLFDERFAEGVTAHIGRFPEIGYTDGGKPKIRGKGKGEYGRIGWNVYRSERERNTFDVMCTIADAGITAVLSAFGTPAAGAAYAAFREYDAVATGQMNMGQWALNAGVSYGAGYTGAFAPMVQYGAGGLTVRDNGAIGINSDAYSYAAAKKAGAGVALGLMMGNNPSALQVGMKAGLMSGLQTNGKWYQFGYDTNNWQRHAAYGAASGAATYITGKTGEPGEDKDMQYAPRDQFLRESIVQHGMMLFDMYSGSSVGDAFTNADWASLQYTTADFAGTLGQKHMQGLIDKHLDRESQPKSSDPWADPLANGLAMLGGVFMGLRKTEQELKGLFDGLDDFDEKVLNWFGDKGFNSDTELHNQGMQVALGAAFAEMGRQEMEDVLKKVVNEGTQVQGDINWALGKTFNMSAREAAEYLKIITGLSSAEIGEKIKTGGLAEILSAAGVTHNLELMSTFIENYDTVTSARINKQVQEATRWQSAMYNPLKNTQQVQQAGFMSGAISLFKSGITHAKNFFFGDPNYEVLYKKDGTTWVRFAKEGDGFKDDCQKDQSDHKYVTKEFADIVSRMINVFYDKTGSLVYVNDYSPAPGEESEFGHHDREWDRGFVVDVHWIGIDNKDYNGNYGPVIGGSATYDFYDRENTTKLIESFIDSAMSYMEKNPNKVIKIYYDDPDVIKSIGFNPKYKKLINDILIIKQSIGKKSHHSNHIHFGIYEK